MNRRRFLELLGSAVLGSGIVYSFPSVIVPKNISTILTPLFWSDQLTFKVVDSPEFGFGFTGFKEAIDNGVMFGNAPISAYDFIPKDSIWMIDKGKQEIWINKQNGNSVLVDIEKPKLHKIITNLNV